MTHAFSSTLVLARWTGIAHCALCLLAIFALSGCGKQKSAKTSDAEPLTVRLIQAKVRTITREVGQPSFVQSYERTAIYPKMTAYIDKWNVDIGDRVNKGAVLAKLFVPELVEEWKTKKANAKLCQKRIDLALKAVKVAQAGVKVAEAQLSEARALLGQFQAQTDRWTSEVKRLTREVDKGVVDAQVLLESQNQLKSSTAARDAAKATILKAQADLLAKTEAKDQDEVGVEVARAALAVADSDVDRYKALVDYLTLSAPFDGVIAARNANTGDFVLPATGDPTAIQRAPDLSPTRAAPIYVVDRVDVVRVFVDVPEEDAIFVKKGTKASVLIRAFRDQPLPATVTRTSWALNVTSRTLRAEIDLPNTDAQILPGMYAYAKVHIERPGVRALPLTALTYSGDKTFLWMYAKDGDKERASRTEVQTGVSDGTWIEVTNRQLPPKADGQDPWAPIDGSEQVIVTGDLSLLTDAAPVRVAEAPAKGELADKADQTP
jgi:multidrug efflux pump subunit AcrA (membrane-fusion protein)